MRFEKVLYSKVLKNNLLFHSFFQFLTFLGISHSLDRLTVMDIRLSIRTTYLSYAYTKVSLPIILFPEKANVLINHSTSKCLGPLKERAYFSTFITVKPIFRIDMVEGNPVGTKGREFLVDLSGIISKQLSKVAQILEPLELIAIL